VSFTSTSLDDLALLPGDIATFHPVFLSEEEASKLYKSLINETDVRTKDKIQLPDLSVIETDTGKLMFVDPELTDFNTFIASHGRRVEWPGFLVPVRDKLESMMQREFNVCVALHYPDGEHWVEYHHDYPAFGCTRIIPSISLGATRTFSLREAENPERVLDIPMQSGDLVIMRENCQEEFTHSILKEPEITEPRINLTFRTFNWRRNIRKSQVRYEL
jgi:alkylated DNA repair dioxygenase AlkB